MPGVEYTINASHTLPYTSGLVNVDTSRYPVVIFLSSLPEVTPLNQYMVINKITSDKNAVILITEGCKIDGKHDLLFFGTNGASSKRMRFTGEHWNIINE